MADQGDHGIAWTDETWNPVRGCSRVSEGCHNCYAEKMAARFSGPGMPYEGLAHRVGGEARWTGAVRLVPERLADPLRWKRPRRVFVNSMSDLFHEALSNEQIATVFGVMAAAPQHTFQVLTKRAERMREWFEWASKERHISHDLVYDLIVYAHDFMVLGRRANELGALPRYDKLTMGPWPLPNVWLGVSVEDQKTADERIPLLLETPAAVRWASYEPALALVDFDGSWASGPGWLRGWHTEPRHWSGCDGSCYAGRCPEPEQVQNPRLDQIVVGGESGPHARPCDVAWIRSVRDQCKAAGLACFVKQLGARPYRARQRDDGKVVHAWDEPLRLRHSHGGDPSEWPADLRVREFPKEKR